MSSPIVSPRRPTRQRRQRSPKVRGGLPRQTRPTTLVHGTMTGSFTTGQLVRVTGDDGDYFAVVERSAIIPKIGEMVRLREITLSRGVETISARRVQELDTDGLVEAIMLYLGAPDFLRRGFTRMIATHHNNVRAGQQWGWLTVGVPDARYSVTLWVDRDLIRAMERYTFEERAWPVKGGES